MSAIQQRIHSLALSESDCSPLSKLQLDELISMVKSLVTGGDTTPFTEPFSIAELSPVAVAAKLNSFAVREQTVFVFWPAFREGFKIHWILFTSRLDDFWYPGSDDVIVTSEKDQVMFEITHEETIRFLINGNWRT